MFQKSYHSEIMTIIYLIIHSTDRPIEFRSTEDSYQCLTEIQKLRRFCAIGVAMAPRILPASAGWSILPTSGSSAFPAPGGWTQKFFLAALREGADAVWVSG